jgi:hypothetical protein
MYLPSDIVSNQLINYEILRRRWGREEEVDDVYGEQVGERKNYLINEEKDRRRRVSPREVERNLY